jgi:hypothetical protein
MKEVNNWFIKLNTKITQTFYKAAADSFDPNESYRKSFKKNMDFFDL